jgi:hypothetical protein
MDTIDQLVQEESADAVRRAALETIQHIIDHGKDPVIIVMTDNAARTLLTILGRVGGNPLRSPRRHVTELTEALVLAGVTPLKGGLVEGDWLWFRDNPEAAA